MICGWVSAQAIIVTDLEVNVDRREDELLRTRDELEAAIALHEPGHVGEPPGIDVEVLVQLPRKRKSEENVLQ